jgi:hypothetical protein
LSLQGMSKRKEKKSQYSRPRVAPGGRLGRPNPRPAAAPSHSTSTRRRRRTPAGKGRAADGGGGPSSSRSAGLGGGLSHRAAGALAGAARRPWTKRRFRRRCAPGRRPRAPRRGGGCGGRAGGAAVGPDAPSCGRRRSSSSLASVLAGVPPLCGALAAPAGLSGDARSATGVATPPPISARCGWRRRGSRSSPGWFAGGGGSCATVAQSACRRCVASEEWAGGAISVALASCVGVWWRVCSGRKPDGAASVDVVVPLGGPSRSSPPFHLPRAHGFG